MKPLAWTSAVLLFAVLALWWRQGELRDDLAHLRMELEEIHARADRDAQNFPRSGPALDDGASPTPSARSRIGVATAESPGEAEADRIADLELVVNGQADVIEELIATVSAVEEQRRKSSARAWGPEQAVGPPDTMAPGDHRTAWAPAQADGGIEWLEAAFANPADAAQVIVRQTCNPGAIVKVAAILEHGSEIPIWTGEDSSKGQQLADTPFSFPAGIRADRVRVYLDTSKVAGWEEIDAVQLVGRDGSRQWARSVNASSTYAQGATGVQTQLTLDYTNSVQFDTLGGDLRERF